MGYFIQFTENDQQLFSVDIIEIFEISFLGLEPKLQMLSSGKGEADGGMNDIGPVICSNF